MSVTESFCLSIFFLSNTLLGHSLPEFYILLVEGLITNFGIFLSFSAFDDFFHFSISSGFRVFLVHLTVVSVLLSASVKRCFVSHMRDFSDYIREEYN